MTERDIRPVEVPAWVLKALDVVFDQRHDEDYMDESLRRGNTTRDEIDATLLVRARLAELEATR